MSVQNSLELVQQAIQLDRMGQYEGAYDAYLSAIASLKQALIGLIFFFLPFQSSFALFTSLDLLTKANPPLLVHRGSQQIAPTFPSDPSENQRVSEARKRPSAVPQRYRQRRRHHYYHFILPALLFLLHHHHSRFSTQPRAPNTSCFFSLSSHQFLLPLLCSDVGLLCTRCSSGRLHLVTNSPALRLAHRP